MNSSLGFIEMLREQPWWGVLIGVVLLALLFWAKHAVVKLMQSSDPASRDGEQGGRDGNS